MYNDIISSTEAIALFCRLQMNGKRDIPIRPSEMGVLIFTEKQSIPVTPLMISKFFKITKPSVTSMIDSLVKKNYLIKTPSSIDRRSYTVSVTAKGREIVELTYNEYLRMTQLLEKHMGSQDFNSFIKLINKANSILSEEK